ncbi:MAG: hypothetical protein N2C14_23955, partial [Planctomycetales bacterium]
RSLSIPPDLSALAETRSSQRATTSGNQPARADGASGVSFGYGADRCKVLLSPTDFRPDESMNMITDFISPTTPRRDSVSRSGVRAIIVVFLVAGVQSRFSPAAETSPVAETSSRRAPAAGRMILQLRETDWILRASALEYLARNRVASAARPIREILDDQDARPWLRGRAIVALARIDGAIAENDVATLAQHENPQLRAAAAEALEYVKGDPDQVTRELLEDDVADVRYRALASLASRRGTEAWPVVDSMTQTADAQVCQWGARALAFVGNDAAMERLADWSQRGDLQSKVVRGIQGVNNPKLIGLLARTLTNRDPGDRRFAAGLSALRQFDQADLLAALKDSLKSDDGNAVRAVARISAMLPPAPELGDSLRTAAERIGDAGTIKAVLAALGPAPMEPDRHRDFFEKHLDHADVKIRELAIRCLAHCRTVNLYEKLGSSVADESPQVVQAALSALRRAPFLDAPGGGLTSYLKSPLASAHDEVRSSAFELLAHAGTPADFQPAMELLKDRLRGADDAARIEAAEVLAGFAPLKEIASVARTQGYVTQWMILGTFLNTETNAGFNQVFPPEKKIDFEAKYVAKYVWVLRGRRKDNQGEIEREIGWTKMTVDRTSGKLNVSSFVPPPANLAVAYAVADFQADADRQVVMSVDGDDAFRVWLNGEKVAEKVAEFQSNTACVAQQQGVKLTLRAGSNRLLIKTANIGFQWWVRVRFTDAAGQPVEVRR